MGASDSKLVFKQGVFKLSEQKDIPADDNYWTGFWELPESAEDVFSLFSSTDIRRIRDESLGNLETLILAITSRLFALKHSASFPNSETAPERDILNCVRILTRVLPYIYEAEHLETWEDKFFWGRRRIKSRSKSGPDSPHTAHREEPGKDRLHESDYEDSKPLAEELIDTLIELLFYAEFTIPKVSTTKSKVNFAIWQSGVGCNTPIGTSKEYESNRMEVLRLILTLASKSMYTSAGVLPVQGVKAITYITTISDKQLVLTLLCSLLNTTLKYNPATWRVPYDHVVMKDPKQLYVTYCLQLLLVLVLYPVPESESGVLPKNYFRHFLGRLHRPQDFQFLVDGMTRILNQPLQANTAVLPGSQKSLTWAPEMIMLFWEVLQCNKRFRSFIVDTDRAHDFVVLVMFQAMEHKNDPSRQGIVRMCIFVLQTLSVEPTFGARLNKTFHGQETLPQTIRIQGFRGSYTDFLLISIHNIITTSRGKLDAIYPALLAIMNNIAPHISDLSSTASAKVMQLFATMSSPTFLLANEANHELLYSLLEAINATVEHQYEKNPNLILAILRAHKRFYALRDFAIDGAQDELDRHARLRKEMAEDPERFYNLSRNGSTESLRSPGSARAPSLSNVPEEGGAFAIGDDEDSEEENQAKPTPSHSSIPSEDHSRRASVSDSNADEVPAQLRGMSEKARGKMPAGRRSYTRQGSSSSLSRLALSTTTPNGAFEPTVAWIETWLAELPMHTILTLIDQMLPQMPAHTPSSTSGPSLRVIKETEIQGIDPSPVRVHLFEWTPLSLGWYESILWGFIFTREMTITKGAPGVWKGTNIKLFRVQETTAEGPSLMAPRGAVDAVGSNLVQRLGSFNLRGPTPQAPQRNSRGGVIRDV